MSLEESLERARIALDSSQRRMLSLHTSWRSQLRRISVVALIIIFKQASTPASECIEEVQKWNDRVDGDGDWRLIGHLETGKLCIADSLMEISVVLSCLSFIWLLSRPVQGDDFSSLPFRLAVFFVPLIVASYYHNPTVGCLVGNVPTNEEDGVAHESLAKPRSFPVVLILLVVGFVSLYMMHSQQLEHREHIQKIEKLREDLLGSSRKTK
jgi:hypothetical protein